MPHAAVRYIECRLTELAKKEVFNRKTTTYVPNYDGRKEEPVYLPAKIPLLLMMGADGIAVGLSTAILPHNFIELLEAEGLRDRFVVVCGGPRITHELAKELGFDAGFGAGTYGDDVASFVVTEMVKRGMK
jgi:hypothetical protein